MIATLIAIFCAGYLLIALEHKIGINKSAVALLMCGALWAIFSLAGHDPQIGAQLTAQLGSTCEILVYLIGAMTIVDLIDTHGGFNVITSRIRTRSKRRLLWLLVVITFFMSAVLDNMTTAIIMIMLLRRIIGDRRERWIFAALIVVAANSGGAWSPIGDVTTIMLWMRGNVTAGPLMYGLLLPSLVSVAVPTAIAMRYVSRGETAAATQNAEPAAAPLPQGVDSRMSHTILVTGVAGLLFVPVFKELTGLPPYMGMIIALGANWALTEILYDRKRDMEESIQNRVSKVVKHIDMPTILFFLGILMAVGVLQSAGILTGMAQWFDKHLHEPYAIAGLIGILSSVVDNVPLVAACMGMYPVADAATAAASADPAFMQGFVTDGLFWHLLSYCAGVGGSLLIIGSAAGVVAMGLEKIEFGWYLRKISPLVLAGYLAGMLAIWLQHLAGL
ncbi:sodium:proton antiporter NhaD [uncultured Alistipes sp.]|uniref:sodium:proton antiporter NhaD n=1 Tax=uncultured Alistipes sp. TaxID=538949 RepID=UPI00266F9A9D|nr:sodium:proton antiporter NhaD [uncultured Alistipes sp.]